MWLHVPAGRQRGGPEVLTGGGHEARRAKTVGEAEEPEPALAGAGTGAVHECIIQL